MLSNNSAPKTILPQRSRSQNLISRFRILLSTDIPTGPLVKTFNKSSTINIRGKLQALVFAANCQIQLKISQERQLAKDGYTKCRRIPLHATRLSWYGNIVEERLAI